MMLLVNASEGYQEARIRSEVQGLADGHMSMLDGWTAIYGLVDPRNGLIRYVGATHDTEQRFAQHIATARKSKTAKDRWILSLIADAKLPIMRILAFSDCPGRDENEWIKVMDRESLLLNRTQITDRTHALPLPRISVVTNPRILALDVA